MSKEVLVIGGSGFLGSHVADELTRNGYNVTIYDRSASPHLLENQKMIVGDILDQDKLREAIKGMNYVYHFAGIADIKEAQDKPIDTVKYNILSSVYIIDACVEFAIEKFFYASTVYVYSEHGSFYRSSKQSVELILENYHKIYGLKYAVLRYGSLYGRRANHFNFINSIIRQAILEKKITRKGDGAEIRDYINILDAARISVKLISSKEPVEYVMLTGSQTLAVKDLLRMVKEIFNNDIEIHYTKDKMESHYEITPYNFKPVVARKYTLDFYHDLGQGILDSIHEVYDSLLKEGLIEKDSNISNLP